MADLTNFNFEFPDEAWQIRFVGTSEKPEWVASDVVAVLYPAAIKNQNYSTYLSKVPEEWKGSKSLLTSGGKQNMITLFESGLYCLIARSESSLAVPFQKWVYEEVLPSIRKTGSYSFSDSKDFTFSLPPAKERLENVRLGIDLLYELGGLDERTGLALKDIVRDILLEDKLKKSTVSGDGRAEWPISDRARHLGYTPNRSQLQKIGKLAAKFYRLRHNYTDENGQEVIVNPPEREQYVDGTTRMVKCYYEQDLDILDKAIALAMEEPNS